MTAITLPTQSLDLSTIPTFGGEPDWLQAKRQEALDYLHANPWPHNKVEEYRYSKPEHFPVDRPFAAPANVGGAMLVGAPGVPGVSATVGITANLEDLDGSIILADNTTTIAPSKTPGVIIANIIDAAREHPEIVQTHLGSVIKPTDNHWDALAMAAFGTGALVYIPKNVAVEGPIAVDVSLSTPGMHPQWILIVVDQGSKATVVVNQHGGVHGGTVVNTVEAIVHDSANLTLITAQDWEATGVKGGFVHQSTHTASVLRDAMYQHTEISFGGDDVYIRPNVHLDGEGAVGHLLGVYLPTGTEQLEHRSTIAHNASYTSSDYVHKGALSDTARATWYGNIKINPDAKQTNSDETNRNLILGYGARADSLPFLEIGTADVATCGHHSSVGQVDEIQRFYLESRGIPRDEATKLLVFAFFAEVLERIELPGLADTVLEDVQAIIDAM